MLVKSKRNFYKVFSTIVLLCNVCGFLQAEGVVNNKLRNLTKFCDGLTEKFFQLNFSEIFMEIDLVDHDKKIKNFRIGAGDIKVILYVDMYCHVCKKMLENVINLLSSINDKNKTSIEVIIKPVGILGNKSYQAARNGIAFNGQGKFEYFFNCMHENQGLEVVLQNIKDFSQDKFKEDINDNKVTQLLEKNNSEAKQLENDLVPLVVIMSRNRQFLYKGYTHYDTLLNAIKLFD